PASSRINACRSSSGVSSQRLPISSGTLQNCRKPFSNTPLYVFFRNPTTWVSISSKSRARSSLIFSILILHLSVLCSIRPNCDKHSERRHHHPAYPVSSECWQCLSRLSVPHKS